MSIPRQAIQSTGDQFASGVPARIWARQQPSVLADSAAGELRARNFFNKTYLLGACLFENLGLPMKFYTARNGVAAANQRCGLTDDQLRAGATRALESSAFYSGYRGGVR